jgi:AP-2 complex subunit alpha
LPIGLTRFCEPLVLPGQEWYTRWSQINGAPQEITEQFVAVTCNPQHITALFKDGFRWAILPNVDTNPNNVVGAGTFHSSRGSVHCYMRLETFPQQNGIR